MNQINNRYFALRKQNIKYKLHKQQQQQQNTRNLVLSFAFALLALYNLVRDSCSSASIYQGP